MSRKEIGAAVAAKLLGERERRFQFAGKDDRGWRVYDNTYKWIMHRRWETDIDAWKFLNERKAETV